MSQRILFVLASPEYLRYFDSTITLLADRGHHVSVGVNWLREQKHARLETLVVDPRVDLIGQVPGRGDSWVHLARAVRGSFDFLRYLHPALAGASALRQRAKTKAAPALVRGLDGITQLDSKTLERFYRVLRVVESAVPVSPRLVDFLRQQRPDVVVVSPLVDLMSNQVDMIRAAQSLGIPVALAVASWDNLTNKGHLRVVPDLVAVWNERQVEEAVTLHGIPREHVTVTGAQLFDRWFERRPSQSRQEYCSMVGLPDDKPFLLYTGSSIFIARSEFEVPFVRKWLAALRGSGVPSLRDVNVVLRPHPFNSAAWEQADFSDLGPVTIWPRARYTPASEASRDVFFDSLYYCTAVVGINTSAMIEAAILNRPVLSLLTPEFSGTQGGTLHFHYLLPENGGFLRVASSLEQHVGQLDDVLGHPDASRQQLESFVRTFIRPRGVEQACTPNLAAALEAAAAPREPAREGVGARIARVLFFPLALAMALVLPPINSEGRKSRGWWRATKETARRWIGRPLERLFKLRRNFGTRVDRRVLAPQRRVAARVRRSAIGRYRSARSAIGRIKARVLTVATSERDSR